MVLRGAFSLNKSWSWGMADAAEEDDGTFGPMQTASLLGLAILGAVASACSIDHIR